MFAFKFSFTLPHIKTFYEEKMSLQELLRKFFIVGCNLNGKLVVAEYLFRLSDDEENYKVFERFSLKCSNTLLCIILCTAWDIAVIMKC